MLIIVGIPNISSAELDEVQVRLLQQYDTPLRWDNVEPGGFHLGGVEPVRHVRLPFHTICLQPGQSTLVLVPPLSMIRIAAIKGCITPRDIEVWLDNGSGLAVRQTPAVASDATFLLVDPDLSDPSIVRIACPANSRYPQEFAVYLSRREILADIAPHREPLPLIGETVRIKRDDETLGLDYYRLDPAMPQELVVEGPVRLAVHNHLRYLPREEQLDQTWRIAAFVDDRLQKHLEYETTAEYRHRLFVDQCEQVLGRLETAYLEIPCGRHMVRLDSTATVYLRVVAQESPDYLLPRINAPSLTAEAARREGFAFDGYISAWELRHDDFRQVTPFVAKDPTAADKLAWRSARDNGSLDGGLQGYLLLRDSYRQRRDAPAVRHLADELRGRHTFYRDLLPVSDIAPGTHRLGWFNTRRLLRPDEPHRDLVLSESHIDDALDNVNSSHFVAVGDSDLSASVYQAPIERSTTMLRLVVDRSTLRNIACLYLQYDDRPPIELRVAVKQTLADRFLVPSEAEAGLIAMRHRHGGVDAGTLGGPFAQFREPAAFIDAGFAELLLPNDIREIRVWSPCGSPLSVALQYRVSRPFRLSETQFLEMCCRSGCDVMSQALSEKFPFTKPDESELSFEQLEVVNHMTGWYRQLAVNAQWFSAGVRPADNVSDRQTAIAARSSLQAEAQALAAARQPLAAIEAWNQVLVGIDDPRDRRLALFGRIDALAELGEQFLHERQLRGVFLYDADDAVRVEAGSRLWHLYQDQKDAELLTSLLCAAVSSTNHPQFVRQLSQLFLERGHAEDALLTALMLPPQDRPLDVVLTAAYQLRWWQTFDAHLGLIGDAEVKAVWQAHRQLDLGAYDAAATTLEAGLRRTSLQTRPEMNEGLDGSGDPSYMANGADDSDLGLAEHLARGRKIAAAMKSTDPAVRSQAVLDLAEWHATHPGPYVWREDTTAVEGCAGAAIVRAFEHDTHATFYRAKPQSPLRLSVLGPLRLKLEMRPVHPVGSELDVNEWIRVRSTTQLWPVPIIDNRASEGLEIPGSQHETIGTAVEQEITLGPGHHDLTVQADTIDLLVRIYSERPQIPLPVLPPLTQDTLDSVLTGTWGTTIRSFQDLGDDAPDLYILRPGCCDPAVENCPFLPWQGRPQSRTVVPTVPRIDTPFAAIDTEDTTSIFLANGDWQSAISQLPADSPEGILQRMTLLLYLKETVPNLAWGCVVAGEELMQSHPQVRGLQPLHRRLTSQSGWTRFTELEDGAGIRRIEVDTNTLESPRQRARAALLAPLTQGEYRIYGDEVLVLRLRNHNPIQLAISLRSEHLEHLPTAALRMTWNVDDLKSETVDMEPGQAQAIDIPIAAGSHFLRVRVVDPLANQYLRIGLQERLDGADEQQLQPVVREIKKDWFVATAEQPLRFSVRGPTWMRIDEFRENHVFSRYESTFESRKEYAISPAPGMPQSMFRVFLRTASTEEQERPPLLVLRGAMPIPDPLLMCYRRSCGSSDHRTSLQTRPESMADSDGPGDPSYEADDSAADSEFSLTDPQDIFATNPFIALDGSRTPPRVGYFDEYPLGGQEDGTWSIGMGYVSRRPLDQGITGGKQDKFVQQMVTHRYFDEFNRNYWTTDVMFRERFKGNPSLGLRNSLWHDAEWLPVSLLSETSGYIQNPGQAIPPNQDQTEFSLNWSGEILQKRVINEQWYHTPSANIFARYMSLTSSNYAAGRVDQDIYTPFKAQHRIGVVLSDALTYQPWLDTQLWLRGTVYTNEDFNAFRPDHVYMRLGWRQLVGYVDFETTYRITRYYATSDRAQPVTQHLIDLDAVHDLWAFDRHLGESSIYVQHDIVGHATTLGVSMTVYLDNGRGYRDFAPNATRFKNAKRFSEAVHANNQLWQMQ